MLIHDQWALIDLTTRLADSSCVCDEQGYNDHDLQHVKMPLRELASCYDLYLVQLHREGFCNPSLKTNIFHFYSTAELLGRVIWWRAHWHCLESTQV